MKWEILHCCSHLQRSFKLHHPFIPTPVSEQGILAVYLHSATLLKRSRKICFLNLITWGLLKQRLGIQNYRNVEFIKFIFITFSLRPFFKKKKKKKKCWMEEFMTSRPYCMFFIYSTFKRPAVFVIFKMKNVQLVSFLLIPCMWPFAVHPNPALCPKEYVLINLFLSFFLYSCFTLYVSREDNLRKLLVACWFLCKVSYSFCTYLCLMHIQCGYISVI